MFMSPSKAVSAAEYCSASCQTLKQHAARFHSFSAWCYWFLIISSVFLSSFLFGIIILHLQASMLTFCICVAHTDLLLADLALVLPLNFKSLVSLEVGSKVFTLFSLVRASQNVNKRHAQLSVILYDPSVFVLNLPRFKIVISLLYILCLALLWAVCYKNTRAFRRHKLIVAHAVYKERKFFSENGLWLLAWSNGFHPLQKVLFS